MNTEIIYRTLLICEKAHNNQYQLIYGHTIHWIKSDLDYMIIGWKIKNLQNNITIFFADLNNSGLIYQLFDKQYITITSKGKHHKILYNYNNDIDHKEKHFLYYTPKNNSSFNPFICYSTYQYIYFFDKIRKELDIFLFDHKEVFEKINSEFRIDLLKYPQLIDTYSFFIPTRIFIHFKGYKDKKEGIGFRLKIIDEFNNYNDSIVSIRYEICNKKYSIPLFKLKDNAEKFSTNDVPDRITIEIKNSNDELIYKTDAGILKSIELHTKLICGNVIIKDGSGDNEVIQTHHLDKITIQGD